VARLLVLLVAAAVTGERLIVLTSPEVADGTVTFRLRAPRAKEVLVDGLPGRRRVVLTRDAAGVWSARVGPLAPGVYEYGFVVDGLRIPDPQNPWTKPSRGAGGSVFEVPGGHLDHEDQGAPRGDVVVIEYRWRGRARRLHVYAPPGHERGPALPVVYLLHGFSDSDATWTAYGRAHVIADNLIADRRCPAAVVVMPDGQPLDPRDGQDRRAYLLANADALAAELRDEIVPLVERRFRVLRNRAGRAVIGFAMGAHQALVAAPLFHAVAAISPEVLPDRVDARRGDLVLLSMQPTSLDRPAVDRLAAALTSAGVAASVTAAQEGGDLWSRWRKQLPVLLPRLVAELRGP
jgi:enterochelin esterase family protein